jgi:hypothetical protein
MLVEHDGERLDEYGPGALLGERSHLERGVLMSTLVVVTPAAWRRLPPPNSTALP